MFRSVVASMLAVGRSSDDSQILPPTVLIIVACVAALAAWIWWHRARGK